MENKKRLIYADDARAAVLRENPAIAYCIDRVKTADAAPVVHGRWIDDGGLDDDGNGRYRCSMCGVGEKHNPTGPVSYCWNCGTKMDKEE